MGPVGNAGAGYLGPRYEPFSLGRTGQMPYFTTPYTTPAAQKRRSDLLRVLEGEFGREHKPTPSRVTGWQGASLAAAPGEGRVRHEEGLAGARDRYGDTEFGRGCFLARKLVEAGVSFVEVGQTTTTATPTTSSATRPTCACSTRPVGLLDDLQERGLLKDTLVVWMGEVGRLHRSTTGRPRPLHPRLDDRPGGGGVKGGVAYGATDADGRTSRHPVSEGDLSRPSTRRWASTRASATVRHPAYLGDARGQ